MKVGSCGGVDGSAVAGESFEDLVGGFGPHEPASALDGLNTEACALHLNIPDGIFRCERYGTRSKGGSMASVQDERLARQVEVGGVRLELFEFGSGKPILVLHEGQGVSPDAAFVGGLAKSQKGLAVPTDVTDLGRAIADAAFGTLGEVHVECNNPGVV